MIEKQHDDILNIHQFEKYAVLLDENGKVWTTGSNDFIKASTTFTVFDSKKVIECKPDEEPDKIVKLSASLLNMSVLTQKGKIWIAGDNSGN